MTYFKYFHTMQSNVQSYLIYSSNLLIKLADKEKVFTKESINGISFYFLCTTISNLLFHTSKFIVSETPFMSPLQNVLPLLLSTTFWMMAQAPMDEKMNILSTQHPKILTITNCAIGLILSHTLNQLITSSSPVSGVCKFAVAINLLFGSPVLAKYSQDLSLSFAEKFLGNKIGSGNQNNKKL